MQCLFCDELPWPDPQGDENITEIVIFIFFSPLLGVVKSRGIQPAAVCCSLSNWFSPPCSPALWCVSGPADGGAGGGWVRLNGHFETVGVSREINWWKKGPASGTRKGNEPLQNCTVWTESPIRTCCCSAFWGYTVDAGEGKQEIWSEAAFNDSELSKIFLESRVEGNVLCLFSEMSNHANMKC